MTGGVFFMIVDSERMAFTKPFRQRMDHWPDQLKNQSNPYPFIHPQAILAIPELIENCGSGISSCSITGSE